MNKKSKQTVVDVDALGEADPRRVRLQLRLLGRGEESRLPARRLKRMERLDLR